MEVPLRTREEGKIKKTDDELSDVEKANGEWRRWRLERDCIVENGKRERER